MLVLQCRNVGTKNRTEQNRTEQNRKNKIGAILHSNYETLYDIIMRVTGCSTRLLIVFILVDAHALINAHPP